MPDRPASDLTDAELAAQEGAGDDPSADLPVLSERELALDARSFLRELAALTPKAGDDSYGTLATAYRDRIEAWLDGHRGRQGEGEV